MNPLSTEESKALMRKYGITLPKSVIVKSKKDAVLAARKIGYPIVMKVYSSKILHKSDVGGVKLNLKSSKEVSEAYDKLMKIKNVEAVIVQKFYEGHWVIVGMKRDPQFGPVIAFGLGGVFVEIIKDVVLRVAPINKKEAKAMINEIKGIKILEGARGGIKANKEKLAKIILKVSKLAMENKEIKEIDLNPIVVNNKEAVAVDVRILK